MKIKSVASFIMGILMCLTTAFCQTTKAEEMKMPNIIRTAFETEEVVVADYYVKSPDYAVDSSGKSDSTQGIQAALNDCFSAGGGTVFLPKGKYRVTSNLYIPPFTALRGDYNDPDKAGFNGDYGTVILADVSSSDANFPSLFTVGGSAAAIGLTVYYPNQSAAKVKPYPYTFEIPSFASVNGHADHMAPTIRNITLINAYKGICASITPKGSLISAANEMIHLENIKGTVLHKGAELYNSSEYGVVRGITFHNGYWANAASYMKPPLKEDIDAFTKVYGIGMVLGDLEWVQFSNISISDYKIGVRLFDGLRRHIAGQPQIYFIGQFFRLRVQNTTTALRIDNMFPNFGITLAECNLQGSLFSIRNEDTTNSVVRLISTQLKGDTSGLRIEQSGGESEYQKLKAAKKTPDTSIPIEPKPPARLYNAFNKYGADKTGRYDSSEAIQKALDAANKDGGGIVYLPAGYYRVSKPLTVYENTELRGCAASAHRDEIGMSKGTLLLSFYGYAEGETEALTKTALITLAGKNAGVRGLRVIYPQNEPKTDSGFVRLHSFVIRGIADRCYVINASLVGAAYGIEFKGTANAPLQSPTVRNVSGTYYRQGICITNTKNVHIEEALSNAAVVARHGLGNLFPDLFSDTWPSDVNGKLRGLQDTITRPNSHFILLDNAASTVIANSFTFASKKVVTAVNSSVTIYNSAGDNLYPSGGALLDVKGGSLTGVNLLRYSGTSLLQSNSTVNLFNRISLLENNDKDIVNGMPVAPVQVYGVVNNTDDLPPVYVPDTSGKPTSNSNNSGGTPAQSNGNSLTNSKSADSSMENSRNTQDQSGSVDSTAAQSGGSNETKGFPMGGIIAMVILTVLLLVTGGFFALKYYHKKQH